MTAARRILAAVVLAVILAVPSQAGADNGGPPTIPAEASIPQAPEAAAPSTPTASPVRSLAETGSDNLPLAAAGLAFFVGGFVLLAGRKAATR